MKTKYYSGPDGVFYDAKWDEFFVLEHEGSYIINIRVRKTIGKNYKFWGTKLVSKKIAVIMSKSVIRLGEL